MPETDLERLCNFPAIRFLQNIRRRILTHFDSPCCCFLKFYLRTQNHGDKQLLLSQNFYATKIGSIVIVDYTALHICSTSATLFSSNLRPNLRQYGSDDLKYFHSLKLMHYLFIIYLVFLI